MTAKRTAGHRTLTTEPAVLGGAPLLLSLVLVSPASPAGAHGSMATPASRGYACFLEGPETPQSAACRAAVAAGGTQALYDWNEVNLANAAGQHRQLIRSRSTSPAPATTRPNRCAGTSWSRPRS